MNTDIDFHSHLHTSEFFQIPDSQNENKSQGKDLSLILQHSDDHLLDFDRVCYLKTRLQRLTLPYLDSHGNILQIWKLQPNHLLGTVLNKQHPLKIIPGYKVRLLAMETLPSSSIIKRLEEAAIKQWDIAYNPNTLRMDVWPHLIAAGKDWFIEVDKSPFKEMTKEQVIEHLIKKGFEYRIHPKSEIGGYHNKTTGESAYIDERNKGNDREPNHVDFAERGKDKVRLYYKDPYSTCMFKKEGEIKRSPQNREFLQNMQRAKSLVVPEGSGKNPDSKEVFSTRFVKRESEFGKASQNRASVQTMQEVKTLAAKQFNDMLTKTGLEESHRVTHPNRPAPPNTGQKNDIGGVGGHVGLIEGLFDTPESLFETAHSFFIPTGADQEPPFTNQELGQILYELAVGIYVHDTVPFFSLHFNKDANLYPVIDPFYEKTLVGQVFSMLDYDMKGYLNGGIFTEAFVKQWEVNPVKLNAANVVKDFVDLESFAKLHFSGDDQNYCSVRVIVKKLNKSFSGTEEKPFDFGKELIQRLFGERDSFFEDYSKFTNSFRIIAKQKKVEKAEDLFVLSPDFDVEYTIKPDREYKKALKNYVAIHGRYPQGYQTLIDAYETMKTRIHDHMVKLPFCKKYFAMLGVINFFSYYFTTLKRHLKVPLLPQVDLQPAASPALFPSLPLSGVRETEFRYNIRNVAKRVVEGSRDLLMSYIHQPDDQQVKDQVEEAILQAVWDNVYSNSNSFQQRDFDTNKEKYVLVCKKIKAKLNLLNRFQDYLRRNQNGIFGRPSDSHLLWGFIYGMDKDEDDFFHLSTHCLFLPEEQSEKELQEGTRIVGGCGMTMKPLKVQKSIIGEEILNRAWEKIGSHPEGHLISFADNESTLPNGSIFTLGFENMPLGVGDHPQEMEELFLSMVEANSSPKMHLHKIVRLLSEGSKDKFIEEIDKQDFSNVKDSFGRTLLHHAAIHQDSFYVEELLKRGYQASEKDQKGYLPIHYAAMSGRINQLKLLITNLPESLDALSNQRATPLIVAIQHEQLEAVEFFLSENANRETWFPPFIVPVMEFVEAFLPRNVGQDEKLTDDYTALHCAVLTGNQPIVEALLKGSKRARLLIDQQTNEGITPLMLACQKEYALARYLIRTGANPMLKTKNGLTALDMAVRSNNLPLCEFLLTCVDISSQTIEMAIKKGSLEINTLLSKNRDYLSFTNAVGDSPLIMALREANIPLVKHILALPNNARMMRKANDVGETSIYFAAQGGFYEIVEELVKRVPDMVSKKELFRLLLKGGFNGKNSFLEQLFRQEPLEQADLQELLLAAASVGNWDGVCELLVPKGVDLEAFEDARGWKIEQYLAKFDCIDLMKKQWMQKKDLTVRDREGKSLVYIAAENKSWRVLEFLLGQLKQIHHSFEKQYQDRHLLYGLLEARNLDGIKIFFEKTRDKAILNRPLDSNQTYAVHLAAQIGSTEIISYLYDQKASLESTDTLGHSALFYAAQCGNKEVVNFLLDKKPRVSIDCDSIFAAARCRDEEIFSSLLELADHSQKEEALMKAIRLHDLQSFLRLVSISPDYQNTEGVSPLVLAFKEEQPEMLEIILSRSPNVLRDQLVEGSLLRTSYKEGDKRCIDLLIKHGFPPVADDGAYDGLASELKTAIEDQEIQSIFDSIERWPVNTYFYIDIFGSRVKGTLLHLLLTYCKECKKLQEAVRAISEKKPFDLSLKDGKGNSYAHLMSSAGLDPTQGIEVNLLEKNALGQTPLHCSIENEKTDCLIQIIKKLDQSQIDIVDNDGKTALTYAVIKNKKEAVEELIKARADLNHRDRNQLTPLLYACGLGHSDIVRMLVKHGADINQRGGLEFLSPLVVSLSSKNKDIPFFLIYEGADLGRFNEGEDIARLASIKGRDSILRLLHAKGRSFNTADERGLAPIHHATIRGNLKTLALLHSFGVSLDSPVVPKERSKLLLDEVPETRTPLHFACQQSTASTVKWLLDHHADPEKIAERKLNVLAAAIQNSPGESKEIFSMLKDLPLATDLDYLFPAAQYAIAHDAVDSLKLMYDLWLPPTTEFENEMNGLHYASRLGSLRSTEFFLKQGIDWKLRTRSRETALELAAINQSVEQFRYLLTQVKPNLDKENKKDQTLLHLAVDAKNLLHVAVLIDEGADLDKQDAQGKTALFMAAQYDYREIIELLMLCDADPDLKTGFTECMPEDVATPEGKKIIAQIRAFKAQAPAGGTPLHIAVTTQNDLAVRVLARHVHINQQNSEGRTALHEAIRYGKLSNARLLLNRGADVNIKDANGKSPLDLALLDNPQSAIATLMLQARAQEQIAINN